MERSCCTPSMVHKAHQSGTVTRTLRRALSVNAPTGNARASFERQRRPHAGGSASSLHPPPPADLASEPSVRGPPQVGVGLTTAVRRAISLIEPQPLVPRWSAPRSAVTVRGTKALDPEVQPEQSAPRPDDLEHLVNRGGVPDMARSQRAPGGRRVARFPAAGGSRRPFAARRNVSRG